MRKENTQAWKLRSMRSNNGRELGGNVLQYIEQFLQLLEHFEVSPCIASLHCILHWPFLKFEYNLLFTVEVKGSLRLFIKKMHSIVIKFRQHLLRKYSSSLVRKRLGDGCRNSLHFFSVKEIHGIELEGNVQK